MAAHMTARNLSTNSRSYLEPGVQFHYSRSVGSCKRDVSGVSLHIPVARNLRELDFDREVVVICGSILRVQEFNF